MSTDHTPAPWLMLSSQYDDGTPYCRISAGKPEIYERETGKGFQIAGILSEADARLIVAAPVLLKALQEIVADEVIQQMATQGQLEAARAAIAGAEGKP